MNINAIVESISIDNRLAPLSESALNLLESAQVDNGRALFDAMDTMIIKESDDAVEGEIVDDDDDGKGKSYQKEKISGGEYVDATDASEKKNTKDPNILKKMYAAIVGYIKAAGNYIAALYKKLLDKVYLKQNLYQKIIREKDKIKKGFRNIKNEEFKGKVYGFIDYKSIKIYADLETELKSISRIKCDLKTAYIDDAEIPKDEKSRIETAVVENSRYSNYLEPKRFSEIKIDDQIRILENVEQSRSCINENGKYLDKMASSISNNLKNAENKAIYETNIKFVARVLARATGVLLNSSINGTLMAYKICKKCYNA